MPGTVAQIHHRDDADIWKGWRRWVYRLTPYLTVLNMALYILYLTFRIVCIVAAQKKFSTTFAAAWLFVAVEVATAIPSLLHNSWTVMSIHKRRRPKLRWMGDDAPTVDVFITACKEDNSVVMDTVRGACDLDYPCKRFRVIVLDDGNVESLAKEVEALTATYPNLMYIARPKYPGVPHHFKAGNLNYGLDASLSFPGGAGEFMAALDADMVNCRPRAIWRRLSDDAMPYSPSVILQTLEQCKLTAFFSSFPPQSTDPRTSVAPRRRAPPGRRP